MHGNKANIGRFSKSKFEIFKLGLIAVHVELSNFSAWPDCGANQVFEFSSLALLRCKMTFKISELGLIAVLIGLALLPCTSVYYFDNKDTLF